MSTLSDQLGLGASFRPGPFGWGEQTSPFPQGSQGEKFFNSLTSNEDKAAINTYVYRAKQKDPSSDGITGKSGVLFALSNNPQYAAQALNYGPPRDAAGNVIPDQFVKGMMSSTTPSLQGVPVDGNPFVAFLKNASEIFLPILLPGVGSAIAESLIANGIVTSQVAANVIGSVVVNTTASVAKGNSFEDALKNSLISAAVNTGSVEVAKEINKFVSNKAVTDAIVSAGGSAVKTAAAGGTEQDIVRNMTGALAGSAASSAYQSAGDDYTRSTGRVIGSTVAGYVTSGGAGAITGALGELGSQSRGKVAGAIQDVVSPQDTGALPASQVAAMTPETDAGAATGELAPVTVTGQPSSDVIDTNIISPNAVTSTPAAAALEPVTVAGQRTGDITDTDIINAITAETTPAAVATPAAEVAAPVTTPAAELPPVTVTGQRDAEITDTDIINTIAAEKKPDAVLQDVTVTGKREEPQSLAPVTITGKKEEPLALEPVTVTGKREELPSLAPVTITGKRDGELEPVTITGKRDGELDPVTITGKADEPAATPEKEPAPKDKPYKPDLFILGGTKPKAPTKPTSVLGQALGTTTGLTASRGAGEIEDTSTGKKRKKVWNEETLRLKDALGV